MTLDEATWFFCNHTINHIVELGGWDKIPEGRYVSIDPFNPRLMEEVALVAESRRTAFCKACRTIHRHLPVVIK